MPYAQVTQMLVDEHAVITSVLDAVAAVATRAERSGDFPQEFFEKAFDFFPAFADKYHHAKEEEHLFPALERRGMPRHGGPIGCMLSEHEEGRRHVQAVREALRRTAEGDATARVAVRDEARAYVDLLRQHIMKENQVLFVMSDNVLTDEDQQELWGRFQSAERSALPPGERERYIALAKELRGFAGL